MGAATDPGPGFYVPSSPTSVDANPSSETAEPRSASSESCDIPQDPLQCHSAMEVDDQAPLGTPRKSSGSLTPTPMQTVESFLRKSAGGSRKRQKLKHVDLGNTSPRSHRREEQPPPTITQPLTNTAPRRKRKNRSNSSRVKAVPMKGKAYRTRSQKPKAVTESLVRAALANHVDVDEDFLEDGRKPQSRLDLRTQANDLVQNVPATVRRRNLVHPSKTQPFPCEPSLGNTPGGLELGRHPRKPMTAWEGALALSNLDIRMPASTVTPRRKGRPIQGSSSSRVRGRYPKLPFTPLSPTPKPTSRGHPVPSTRCVSNLLFWVMQCFAYLTLSCSFLMQLRLHLHRGPPGEKAQPEVAAIPIISAEEVTSPHSELGSEHEFGSSALNPVVRASDRDRQDPGSAGASGAAVTHPSRSQPQEIPDSRKVHFSSPLATDADDHEPDVHPIILVPNSSDPNLASRVSPEPSNRVSHHSLPHPLPSPHLLFVQSHPHSFDRTQGHRVSAADSDVERDPGETDAFGPPITVSTESKTCDDKGNVASGGLKLSDVKDWEGLEAENVDQNQSGAGSRFSSQDPAETLLGNVQHCISPQGVRPHSTNIIDDWNPDMREEDDGVVRQSPPAANQPLDLPDGVEDSKPMKPLMSSFDRLTVNVRRVESEARSKLQAEVEGDEGDAEVVDTSKGVTNSNGPPHSTSFPPLGRMLSLLDEAGPSRSLGGFGRTITRRPRRPISGRRFSKGFQTQPAAEVESGWQSEGPSSNVNARRSGAGVSKSDDLSYFAGL